MLSFDLTPWLVVTIPYLLIVAYVTYRGLAQREFRVIGKYGWARYRVGSFDWWLSTMVNFALLAAGVIMLKWSVYNGADFARDPVPPMPAASGKLIETAHIDKRAHVLAQCLSELNHAKTYATGPDGWLVAVRNGRNSVMYTFEVRAEGTGSRMDIRRRQVSPFVSWKPCLRP